jgi:putative peptide zinc metalloprotease protein
VFYILQQLDGNKSIEQLIDGYHEEHAPKRITRTELQQLLTRFHRDGLVISDVGGQGNELLKRGRKNLAMERFGQFSNILAIRYRGFDPERILNFLIKYTWWLFTPTAAIIVGILATIALLSVLINFAEFSARLPGFDAFFNPRKMVLFVGVLCVTKICHEFGHGLACKRLGGECHEIGFMLLVLTPCLYCNVSDSWRLENKWHRAAIGAAGMYIEVLLATIATFVWWFVQPGMVQDICLQVMLISSVSTIVFNGNPLLRYDGYYIMSDLLEIPNLSQKSTKALTTLLGRHWLGLEIPDDQLMPSNRPVAFAMFTVASFLYRWFILFAIVTFLIRWLEPYGLESIGIAIAMFSMVGILVMPMYKLYRYMSVPGRMHQVEKVRFSIISSILLAALAFLLFWPLPHRLRCTVIVVPASVDTVYVEEDGIVEKCLVKEGESVEPGQTVAVLRNIDLEIELNDAISSLQQKRSQRDSLIKGGSGIDGISYLDSLSVITSEIRQLEKRIMWMQARQQRLTLKSKIGGTVLAVPYQHPASEGDEMPLLDKDSFISGRNGNVVAQRQQRFCEVADLSDWYAVVLLTEDQIKFAEPGMQARIKLYARPDYVIETEVESIGVSDRTMNRRDYNVSADKAMQQTRLPDLVAEMVAAYQQTDIQYYARVPIALDASEFELEQLKIGIGGQARLRCKQNRSLGARLLWWLNQTFRL